MGVIRKSGPSPAKARQMLKDDSANGKPLSKAQKGYFGAIIGRSERGSKKRGK